MAVLDAKGQKNAAGPTHKVSKLCHFNTHMDQCIGDLLDQNGYQSGQEGMDAKSRLCCQQDMRILANCTSVVGVSKKATSAVCQSDHSPEQLESPNPSRSPNLPAGQGCADCEPTGQKDPFGQSPGHVADSAGTAPPNLHQAVSEPDMT